MFSRSQKIFRLANSIFIFCISIKTTLLRLLGIDLRLDQLSLLLKVKFHFLGYFLISQQFINFCHSFKQNLPFYLQIRFIYGSLILAINFINRLLNLLALLLNERPIELKFLLLLRNTRIFRIAASLIGKSFIKISLRISDLFLILRTHHFNRSKSRVVSRSINITASRRIRNVRSTGGTGDTSATGRITKNCVRGNTGKTPTGRSIARIIVTVFAIPNLLLIIELLLHILKVVLLLKSHFLLLILPIAAGLYTTKESVSSTRSNITNSTSSGRTH